MRMMMFEIFVVTLFAAVNSVEEISFNARYDEHDYDSGNTSVEISDDAFSKVNTFTDLNAVMAAFGIELPTEEEPFIHAVEDNRTSVLRNFKNTYHYMSNPEQAVCNPELTAVDLDLETSSDVQFYPSCIRVKRCGGCCPNKARLACQPIASEKVIVKVIELTSKNNIQNEHVPVRSTRSRRVKVNVKSFNVTVEEHTACACMCRLKETDCNIDIHTYDEAGCSCTCKNRDDEEKCKAKSSHLWDQATCQCLCRNPIGCSTGQEFKHDTCMCESTDRGSIAWGDLFLRSKSSSVRHQRKPVEVPLAF